MGLMKTLSQSSKELKDILDRLTALESGETFVTKEMFNSLIGENIENIMLSNYPIGSIYLSVDSANPSTKFGGTWVAWGSGRVPVGVDTTDVNFNAVEKIGGEKEHKLTISEMPKHGHPLDDVLSLLETLNTNLQSGNDITLTTTESVLRSKTQDVGEDIAHNNLQPYITCYMWKRVA